MRRREEEWKRDIGKKECEIEGGRERQRKKEVERGREYRDRERGGKMEKG